MLSTFIFTIVVASQIVCPMELLHLHEKSTVTRKKDHSQMKDVKNSLTNALSTDPLSIWLYEDRFPTLRKLHLDIERLNSSIGNRENKRLERILEKVLRGENVEAVVFGGSNTAGGGLQEEEHSIKGTFFNIFNDWWKKVVTPATGSQLKIKAIAIGGTSSPFHQFCYKVYLEDEYFDLVMLELSVNDARAHILPNVNQSLPLEQLTRQLLKSPSSPALFYINQFYSDFPNYLGCYNLMDLGQCLLNDRYNITTFDLRNLVCEFKEGKFYITPEALKVLAIVKSIHTNLMGNAQLAFMIIDVISKSLLKIMNQSKSTDISKLSPLPSPVFIKGLRNIIRKPLCWTTVTPNIKQNVINNSLRVSIIKNHGFSYGGPIAIGGIGHPNEVIYRTDAFAGWFGEKRNSEITFAFSLFTSETKSMLSRSVGLVCRTTKFYGVFEVWLDDHFKDRVTVSLNNTFRQSLVRMVATRVAIGRHTLTIRIVESGIVPIVGVVVGPSDGPY